MTPHTSESIEKILDTYNNRAKNIDLTWCIQAVDVLEKYFKHNEKFKLLDIGCCYFQLWKEIKKRKIKKYCTYTGLDSDSKFIELGLKYFPELKKKYLIDDLENIETSKYDVLIMSAVLEHLDDYEKTLDKLLNSSADLFIFRTFLSEKDKISEMNDPNYVQKPYLINEYSIYKFSKKFINNGYSVDICPDKATENSKPFKVLNHDNFVRQMFFIVCKKQT